MGYQEYLQPCHYYSHEEDDNNKLKNVNNIWVDVVCPGCYKPKPPRVRKPKIVNINNINISINGHRVKHDCW